METSIKVAGAVVLTDELRTFIDTKVEKLTVFVPNDPTAHIRVEIGTVTKNHASGIFRVEVHMTFTGGNVYAAAERDTLNAAIDKAVSDARRSVRTSRTKHRNMIRAGAQRIKEFFRGGGEN